MRFHCGPSIAERWMQRWLRDREWHVWFAWYPVRLSTGVCVWWEYVERRNTGPACYDGWDEWETREVTK